jgi:glycosyltransferase involved in cell wall biosynthesis
MRTILFDHQIFESQPFGGISKVYCDRIPFLKHYFNCIVSVKASNNHSLKTSGLVNKLKPIKYVNLGFFTQHHLPLKRTLTHILNHSFQNKLNTIRQLQKSQFDIFEPTYYDPYFLKYIGNKPFVLEIHDMVPELLPQYYQDGGLVANKLFLIKHAAHIHTPSKNTKKDILELYGIDPLKITVIPHGVPVIPHDNNNKLFDFPYLLYIGGRWNYKNFTPFLKIFAKTIDDFPEIHLVCTGPPFNEVETRLIQELHIQDKIHYISPIISQFHSLYHNAVAFVFPSLYEGFGLPILEAWSCGCPVLLNDSSCFPEIAGNAALYFELNEKRNNFYDALKQLWQMSSEDRQNLINKGYKRMELYSWEESVEKLTEIYNRL